MADINLDESKLKELLKVAIVELMQEQKEALSALLTEVIKEIALEKAIREGENTELVRREAIFEILDSRERT